MKISHESYNKHNTHVFIENNYDHMTSTWKYHMSHIILHAISYDYVHISYDYVHISHD